MSKVKPRITRHTIEQRLFEGEWHTDPDRPWVRACAVAMTKKIGRNCIVNIPSRGFLLEARSWRDMNRKLDNLVTLEQITQTARKEAGLT